MASQTDEKGNAAPNASNFIQLHVLNVLVSEAKDLRAADLNGKSDPYVRVCVLDENGDGMGQFETEVVYKNNKNPKWNKLHMFPYFKKPASIVFEIWDRDDGALNGRDDELGTFAVNVKQLNLFPEPRDRNTSHQQSQLQHEYQIKDKWYNLFHIDTNRKGRRDSNAGM